MSRLVRAIVLPVALLALHACDSQSDGLVQPPGPPVVPPPPPGTQQVVTGPGPFLVSDARAGIGATLLDPPGGGTGDRAWVALRPGTLPGLNQVRLRVQRTGVETTAALHDGGLDPVAIEASAGDTVVLTVSGPPGPTPAALVFTVPERRPPVIVRTVPPKGTRDVALNSRMQVIFSEPVGASVLADGSIVLRVGGLAVAGQLRFVNQAHTAIEFAPQADLSPGTTFEFVIDGGIRDLDGTALGSTAIVDFATVGAGDNPPPPPPAEPPVIDGEFAFVRDGRIWLANPSGQVALSDPDRSVQSDRYPVWSPDGTQIAFERRTSSGGSYVYVMNADGTNERLLVGTGDAHRPSWTADGYVVYAGFQNQEEAVMIVRADGSHPPQGIMQMPDGHYYPAISPIGRVLAFSVWGNTGGGWWGGALDLHLLPLNLVEGPRPLTHGTTFEPYRHYVEAKWSPDEQMLALTECSDEFVLCVATGSLAVIGADGTGYRVLAPANDFATPTWSPDGSWIAYSPLQSAAVAPCIRRISPAGGASEELIANAKESSWRPR